MDIFTTLPKSDKKLNKSKKNILPHNEVDVKEGYLNRLFIIWYEKVFGFTNV